MSEYRYDAFISYSHTDQGFVRRLAYALSEAGISVFVDQTDLAVGDALVEAIADAVRAARFLLVVMSPEYFDSHWTASELQLALGEELAQRTVKVLPILRRPCNVPPLLASKMWADFTTDDKFPESLTRLLIALRSSHDRAVPVSPREHDAPPAVGQVTAPLDDSVLRAIRESVNDAVRTLLSDTPRSVSSASTSNSGPIESNRCFIVMPFGSDDLTVVYEDFVHPTIEACGLVCERGDDLFGSNVVMDDIQRSIERARLIVADLTGRNANVFYEVGIAHALRKPVLLLAQSMGEVPFDLRHRRVLVYEYSPRGCRKLETHLMQSIKAMLGEA